ncbi:MAG TPA: UDP-N-acetylmuramate--L-alanine ligase, partial [Spirochaeta sp.]|nr:UDP-N-acetylmuramate--L-alanine ligase [Spirochaeta sp.]
MPELNDSVIYFVGIKGTGMTALAEIFRSRGAIVTGSDVEEKFYTDVILHELGIPVYEGFSESNIPEGAELLVHSAAYSPETHPEILKAKQRGINILSYAEALGCMSLEPVAAGIAGVHGKTTTTALAGTIMKEFDLPASVLTGSAAANFGGRSTYVMGERYFIAETCEYKRNFLNFHPDYIIITSVEADHLDYYRDYEDVLSAFIEYAERLPENGTVIYCADNAGAVEASVLIAEKRSDLRLIPYGFNAEGDYRITSSAKRSGELRFNIARYGETVFTLKVPGRHNILNSTAAAALIQCLLDEEGFSGDAAEGIASGLVKFCGTRRRSEIVGEAGGIVIMDDYGHHPAAIKTTIAGLRDFYPDRRIVVDFMSHTYSRTEALLDDFASSFGDADLVL